MTRPFLLAPLMTAALTLNLGVSAEAKTVQAAAPAASTPSGGPDAGSAVVTVIVQRGETAYSIAKRNGLSIDQLLSLNNLATPDLEVGQMLLVRAPIHVTQRGDTLYAVARQYGVSVDALLAANLLPRDSKLEIGQTLKVPFVSTSVLASAPAAPAGLALSPAPKAPTTPALGAQSVSLKAAALREGPAAPTAGAPSTASAEPQTFSAPPGLGSAEWYTRAMELLGTPYVLGGTSRTGLDCSGFVLQVFAPLGVTLPRRSIDQARAGLPVDDSELQPGDLVFFDTLGQGKVSHVGIYLGDDRFVNANSYHNKVVVDRLKSDKYWAPRYLGARRVMMDLTANR